MGMFDEIRCRYPLPVPGWEETLFQTKDTPEQWMEQYEIRADGTLWHEDYDIEDRSDPKAEGLLALCGCMTRVNCRWVNSDFTGEIRFCSLRKPEWIEFSAYFVKGAIALPVQLIEHQKPERKATT